MKSKDPKAPYKGLTVKQFMAKKYPDITLIKYGDMTVLVGQYCGFAEGPMTDTGCIHVCPEYSSCTAAMEIGDLACIVEGGSEKTWCDVCGDTIVDRHADAINVNARGSRYKTCCEGCAQKVR